MIEEIIPDFTVPVSDEPTPEPMPEPTEEKVVEPLPPQTIPASPTAPPPRNALTDELIPGELPPTVSKAPPQIAFYDENGSLILWYQGGVVDPPEGSKFQAILPSGINGAETWYDVDNEKLMMQTNFPIEIDYENRTISNIPKGTKVYVNGEETELVDVVSGKVKMSTPGPLFISLINPRYLTDKVIIFS